LSDKTVLNSDSSAASNNSLMDGVVWEQAEAEAFRSVDESIELVYVCRGSRTEYRPSWTCV